MIKTVDLSVEHVLLFVVLAFLLYHLIGGNCYRDGFSVGGHNNYTCFVQGGNNPDKKKCQKLGCARHDDGYCIYKPYFNRLTSHEQIKNYIDSQNN